MSLRRPECATHAPSPTQSSRFDRILKLGLEHTSAKNNTINNRDANRAMTTVGSDDPDGPNSWKPWQDRNDLVFGGCTALKLEIPNQPQATSVTRFEDLDEDVLVNIIEWVGKNEEDKAKACQDAKAWCSLNARNKNLCNTRPQV